MAPVVWHSEKPKVLKIEAKSVSDFAWGLGEESFTAKMILVGIGESDVIVIYLDFGDD